MKKYIGILGFALVIIGLLVIVNVQVNNEARLIASNKPVTISNEDVNDSGESGYAGSGSAKLSDAQLVNPGYEFVFSPEKYPYRATLSMEEQTLYNQIYANAMKSNSVFLSVGTVSKNRLGDVMEAVTADHPELFWLKNQFRYTYDTKSGNVHAMELEFHEFDNLPVAKQQFNEALNKIVSEANKLPSDVEKEKFICDAISKKSTTKIGAKYDQSAYSSLVTGETVCAGHTRAVQLCLQEVGINAYYVLGTANNGFHAWNMVQLDGEFYNLDSYWNDCLSEANKKDIYPFFNLTDEEMNVEHMRSGISNYLPRCEGKKYTYESCFGKTVTADVVRKYWEGN